MASVGGLDLQIAVSADEVAELVLRMGFEDGSDLDDQCNWDRPHRMFLLDAAGHGLQVQGLNDTADLPLAMEGLPQVWRVFLRSAADPDYNIGIMGDLKYVLLCTEGWRSVFDRDGERLTEREEIRAVHCFTKEIGYVAMYTRGKGFNNSLPFSYTDPAEGKLEQDCDTHAHVSKDILSIYEAMKEMLT